MFTEVMVNANNERGYKWIPYKEWLIDYLGCTSQEASDRIKKQQRKYNER